MKIISDRNYDISPTKPINLIIWNEQTESDIKLLLINDDSMWQDMQDLQNFR